MINNEKQNSFSNEKKEKKKRFLLILFLIIFLVPIGFGIYALIPDRPAPIVTYEAKLVNDYDGGLTISQNTAYPDRIFTADITVNRSVIRDKFLPNSLSSNDVLCAGEPISYSYKINRDRFSAHITIPSENIKGNITINIPLVTPTETFSIILKANGGKFDDGFTMKVFNVSPGSTLNDLPDYSRPSHFREGYHFTHWELESDREQKLYEDEVIPLALEGAIYVANCELNEIKMHIDPNGGAFPGMKVNEVLDLNTVYDTTINQILAYPGEPTKDGHKFLYYIDDTNKQFYPTSTVTIPNELDDNFCLKAIYAESLTITLDSNGGVFPPGAQTTFNTHKGITLSELEGYVEPTNGNLDFTHWEYNGQEYQKNTVLDLSGNIVLIANYAECKHPSFSGYTVANNQLYGICEICGAQILIDDSKLSIFNNKFLYFNGTGYDLYSIDGLSTLVSSATTGETLDIYLINGEYDLECSRPSLETLVTVHMHGLLNNDEELNAAVDCTNVKEGYPRFYENIDFVFDNLIMKGQDEGGLLSEVGLRAHNIEYNNCHFISFQSFHSVQVICNDCYFDATTRPGAPEYSIYSYATLNVEVNRCNFLSYGKAIKIYSEGAAAGAVFKFTDCHFMIEGEEAISEKAAIQVDSSHQSDANPYKVYITRCSQEKYKGGLYADSSTHTTFIVN